MESIELLRQAAREMRHDTFNGQTEDAAFIESVADLLEVTARLWPLLPPGVKNGANGVAEAYIAGP